MSKMSDFLKKVSYKKKGMYYPEQADTPQPDTKTKNKAAAPAPTKKPPTRSAGRGR